MSKPETFTITFFYESEDETGAMVERTVTRKIAADTDEEYRKALALVRQRYEILDDPRTGFPSFEVRDSDNQLVGGG